MIFERHKRLLGSCFERIRRASFLVAGLGGLGSYSAEILTRMGAKKLFLVDYKKVDEPDLNRQVLYFAEDVGRSKVEVARDRLLRIRGDVEIEAMEKRIDDSFDLPEGVDVVLDCLDNFESRFVLSRKAWDKKIPLVHAGVKEYSIQITTILPGKTQRLEEVFKGVMDEETPQVFPPSVAVASALQVSEAVNAICGRPLSAGKLVIFDLFDLSMDFVKLS